ncbi:extracellular solute-binding protein [Paenibacillus whitsoniae]|uniref:Extracellular solute-binding protein n=1 Tax=Paenibacillus whitsoniae TaxID=2496558 RepID=A0A430JCL1_9BACL|nr:extracellular solute-binding protein [Paenibacillus whitsoniae]RTE08737.1 extracellular solute-binding protein [Paenibacillus whitsoniae]
MIKGCRSAALLVLLAVASAGCGAGDGRLPVPSQGAAKRGSITVSIYDRGITPASEGTVDNNIMTRWINEAGPVDVKFIPVSRTQSEQGLNTLFAAEKAPDLILEYAPQVKNTLIDRKLIQPIEGMIKAYSTEYKELLRKYPILKRVGTGADGQLYQFGRINETIPQRGVFIRKDWLQKLGLNIPKTTDELYLVAKAFAERDPDGNGKKDTYGIAMSYNSGAILDEMFGVTYPDYVVKNGELVHGWDHIEAVTAFKKRLYEEGIVDRSYFTDKTGSRAKYDFLNGKTGIFMEQFNVPVTFLTDFYMPLLKNVPEADLAIMPYPETPVGRFNPIFVNPVQMTGVVNAKAKDPEAVMKYVDFASSERFMKTMYYGFEGIHSKSEAGVCPQVTDLMKWRTEFNYASGDFAMLASPILAGNCYYGTRKLSNDDPLQKRVKEMFERNSLNVDFNLQTAGPTHSEQMPQPPKELQQILTDMTRHVGSMEGDIWIKAVLTPGYSPMQARQDAVAAWESAGGEKVDEWYRKFYATDKSKIILTEDIYRIFQEQRAAQNAN